MQLRPPMRPLPDGWSRRGWDSDQRRACASIRVWSNRLAKKTKLVWLGSCPLLPGQGPSPSLMNFRPPVK